MRNFLFVFLFALVGVVSALNVYAEHTGQLRLTSDNILLAYYNGSWRGVCDDSFDTSDGEVACRQLGGEYHSHRTSQYYSSSDFALDDLDCRGNEYSLDECRHSGWGVENCGSSEHVSLECHSHHPPPPPPPSGSSCYDDEGRRRNEGETWEQISRDPMRERVSCTNGGRRYEVYDRWVEKRCDRGNVYDTGRERKGRFIGYEGECNSAPPPQPPQPPHPPQPPPPSSPNTPAHRACYLQRYPDICVVSPKNFCRDPYKHYVMYGQSEGRIWGCQ